LSVCRESVPDSSRIMTGWFSRRSGSRVSIFKPVRPSACFEHQVFRETLCPLGQPEKAIGEKSQIEPWLALHNHSACLRQQPNGVIRQHHESAAKEASQSLVTILGLDGKTIYSAPSGRRRSIFLDCGNMARSHVFVIA
jgi:hypothetical protein